MIKVEGSVRVDLLGGTLDLNPINLILKNVCTLNLATSLKAEVTIKKNDSKKINIESLDYDSHFNFDLDDFNEDNLRGSFFGHMNFIAQIIASFGIDFGVDITLKSGSPAGAGLGGSSSMGVTFYRALCELTGVEKDPREIIATVQGIESRILDSGPAGYQDYYPALYGGILALRPHASQVEVRQLFSSELKDHLERSLTLVYSGETRLSGINNWEVYKGFFDKDEDIRNGLSQIAELSHNAFRAIEASNLKDLCSYIKEEGATRERLFSGIVSPRMRDVYEKIKKEIPTVGLKVCGAGGGGCFLLIHEYNEKELVKSLVEQSEMKVLEFSIEAPL